jgi:hypothetical protein
MGKIQALAGKFRRWTAPPCIHKAPIPEGRHALFLPPRTYEYCPCGIYLLTILVKYIEVGSDKRMNLHSSQTLCKQGCTSKFLHKKESQFQYIHTIYKTKKIHAHLHSNCYPSIHTANGGSMAAASPPLSLHCQPIHLKGSPAQFATQCPVDQANSC